MNLMNKSFFIIQFCVGLTGLCTSVSKLVIDFCWHVVRLVTQFLESPVEQVKDEH